VSLKINDYTQNVSGVGPFGTGESKSLHGGLVLPHCPAFFCLVKSYWLITSGLDVTQDNGVWKLELIHGSRLPRHAASQGSGYSVLFAKHLAFGSLPFAENKHWVLSIYINPEVLRAIKTGKAIKDGKSFAGNPLQVLRKLPATKEIDAFYHTGKTDLRDEGLGCILNDEDEPVKVTSTSSNDAQTEVDANWCRAVTGIALGGLVPQASKDLATAVAFTVGFESKSKEVGDIVDALEKLINTLHFCDRGANIFGDYVTERCEALQMVKNVHYATPSRYDTQEVSKHQYLKGTCILEAMANTN